MNKTVASKRIVGHVVSRPVPAKPYEMGLLTLWLTITLIPPFPGITPLLYLMVLYFTSFLILDAQRAWSAIYRSLIVLPLPILGMLSTLWSPYPAAAFRTSLLFLTSAVIVIIIGSRYSPKQVLRCLLVAGLLGIAYATPYIATASTGGPYASKNYLAFHMLIGYIACLGLILDRDVGMFWKAIPALFAAIAAYIVFQSDAVTSQLLLMGSTLLIFTIRYIFAGSASVDGLRSFLFLIGSIGGAITLLVTFNFVDASIVDDLLGVFGKDSSLTGRTDLWSAANSVITEHPVGGVGLEGFWQYDVGAAQTLNENDSKAFGTKLTFHNAYLEVAVHLGMVGLILFILSVLWVTIKITNAFVEQPDIVTGTFIVFLAIGLVSSFTESLLWGTFNTPASMFFVAGTLFSCWHKPRIVAALVSEPA